MPYKIITYYYWKRGTQALPSEENPEIYSTIRKAILKLGILTQRARAKGISSDYGIVDVREQWPYSISSFVKLDGEGNEYY